MTSISIPPLYYTTLYYIHSQLGKIQGQTDKQMTMLRAQHAADLTQLRDYRSNEVDTLTRKLQAAERELQMNNPLVLTLTHKGVTYVYFNL